MERKSGAAARTKLPNRTIYADDLVIEVDGVEYRPHAGEHIVVRAMGETMDDSLLHMRVLSLQAEMAQAVDRTKLDELENLAEQAMSRFATYFVSWDWTDDAGQPYPSPPTVDVLRSLHPEELKWLRSKVRPAPTAEQQRDDS